MSTRWLLLLGSNLDDEARLRQALSALARLGVSHVLGAVRRLPAYDGAGEYHNALAELAFEGDRGALDGALKRLEVELGRRRDVPGEVAIDIDILACHDGAAWRADPHARAKGEFDHDPARVLLQQAGIEVERAGAPAGRARPASGA